MPPYSAEPVSGSRRVLEDGWFSYSERRITGNSNCTVQGRASTKCHLMWRLNSAYRGREGEAGERNVRKKMALDLGLGGWGELWQVAGEKVRALQTQCCDNGSDIGQVWCSPAEADEAGGQTGKHPRVCSAMLRG